jgi:hypothetical protein
MPDAPQIPLEFQRSKELIDALWNDKEMGPKVQKLVKEKYNVRVPLDDIEPSISPLAARLDEMAADLKAEREARAAEKKAADEEKQKLTMEQALDGARRKYNLTDEGFDKMVARMKETGNYYDADAAGAWVAQSAPPKDVPGPTWMPQDINLFGTKDRDESLALLHKDPSGKFFDNEVSELLRDPDKYVRETFGAAA